MRSMCVLNEKTLLYLRVDSVRMIDFVRPGSELPLKEMADRLGYKDLVFVYEKLPVNAANAAVVCTPKKIRSVQDRRALAIVPGSAYAREAIERGADMIVDVEDDRKDSVHYRRSGLNQVLCRLAARKNVTVGFSFASIINAGGFDRAILLGRIRQNIMLCRKFGVKMCIASFAEDPLRMRAPADLRALFHVLGMHPAESLKALRKE